MQFQSNFRTYHSRVIALFAAAMLFIAVAACGPGNERPDSDVGIQMFQWNWDSIAAECPTLADNGISWVLTSPIVEHVQGDQWWTSYQPVSYKIDSKLGNREQFAAMVSTCNDAGVEIIADAVINHMSGMSDGGTGVAGSEFEHRNYPGIYGPDDFHTCGTSNDDIVNYNDRSEVQNCELVNLADLKTESETVQATIVAHLEDLLDLGVAGFRIDAAKHIPAQDVEAIVSALPQDTRIIGEVIRAAGEPIQPEEYTNAGGVFEFSWGRDMKSLQAGTTLSTFFKAGTTSQYLPSESAYTFVENHDTERGDSTMNYQSPNYELFTALMLASPYGTPVLYSGYAFSDRDAGAALKADGEHVANAECVDREFMDGAWTCQQRWPGIVNMVQWRIDAADTPIVQEWSEGDGLAFARDGAAFIAVNRGIEPLTGTWQTTLEQGKYCDGGAGTVIAGDCNEPTITVDQDGTVAATIPSHGFLAVSNSTKS